jgi:hypothetical protein
VDRSNQRRCQAHSHPSSQKIRVAIDQKCANGHWERNQWLTTLFISFGLFARVNGATVTALLVSAFSVSGAVLLILELYAPYEGLIKISSAPLRAALAQLGN